MFRDYSLVSDEDKKFTEYVNLIKNALKDDFVKYDSGYGYQTDEFQEFCADLLGDFFEDREDNIYVIYHADIENVTDICNFLVNYDMIVLNKQGRPITSRSNHPDVANLIKEMFKIL